MYRYQKNYYRFDMFLMNALMLMSHDSVCKKRNNSFDGHVELNFVCWESVCNRGIEPAPKVWIFYIFLIFL